MEGIAEQNDVHIFNIRQLATEILQKCTAMENLCRLEGIAQPNLAAGSDTGFWSAKSNSELAETRTETLGQLDKLTALIQGPHEFLHEFTASNWDHGALYVFLQHRLLDSIVAAPHGRASISKLSKDSGIPKDKLERILGLLRCRHIIEEPEAGVFALTTVSEELVHDPDFAQWVGFQLYETRVASAHLADALAGERNSYSDGVTGFKEGFREEMYEWHARHPEKGERFRRAMKGVSSSLDPADNLIREWFNTQDVSTNPAKVVELGGRYGFASISLAEDKRDIRFEVRCDTQDFLQRGEALVHADHRNRITFTHVNSLIAPAPAEDARSVSVYLIRNLLWNWRDEDVVALLRSLLPTLKQRPDARIVITDGVSPASGDFPLHIEIGYRRRDITTMTMHNAKQRSQAEWLAVFGQVDPGLEVRTKFQRSAHVYKGSWELRLKV